MAGSRQAKSSENSSRSKPNPFKSPPEQSGVDLSKRIDVACFWMTRNFLRVTGPFLLRPINNSIRIDLFDDREWFENIELPYINIGFFDEKAETVSTDGSTADNGENEIAIAQVYYYDPDFLEKLLKVVRDWYQRVLDIGRYHEAVGTPEAFIHGEFKD